MNPRSLAHALLLLPSLVLASPRNQAPDAPWLTFTTAHYRVHCPAAFEAFGREVAGRVEGIHAQYLGLLGYAYEKPMDILILDPVMEANGMALPLLRRLRDEPDLCVGENEPYGGHLEGDSVDRHAIKPGRVNVLIELRNDLIRTDQQQWGWAERLAPMLEDVLDATQL